MYTIIIFSQKHNKCVTCYKTTLGKPIEVGGSLCRREATGRGVTIVTQRLFCSSHFSYIL